MSTDAPILPSGNTSGKRISIALAVAVHLLLAGFLFYGVRWQTKATDVVEVELVRATPEPVAAPAPPIAVPPAPTPEPPPAPKAEPKPLPPPPKPDIAIKEKEKPKPPPKPEPKPRFDPFQEQLKGDAEREITERKQADSAARELSQIKEAQAKAARDKATASYADSIMRSIRPKIMVPPGVKGNPEAVFNVTQLPSGDIVNVNRERSSGNSALDAAIERAILKSSPLPKPQSADVFSRELKLRFRPLDD
ncbi:MAG: energy transducer TonB [Sulfuritalea sp.]|nr:energy transducer TonB [Sulfuritalea sp.]MDP1984977.1 energy transducer TonB [Sulfuritalea sp.]